MSHSSNIQSADLHAVLRTALDAVVVMRLDGTIAGWNEVATRTFGWTFAETEGRPMSEMIIPQQYREAHEKGLAHYLATGEGPVLDRHFEISALRNDGSEIPVELSITPTDQFGERVFLGFLRDISERHEAKRQQELLLGELNHRVKNMLAVVSGIAYLTARSATSVDGFTRAFSGRLEALGRAHEILTAGVWRSGSLTTLAEALLGPYSDSEGGGASAKGPNVMLSPKQFLSMSMILHELITNATKYGALSAPGGKVVLEWDRVASGLRIDWKESGGSGVVAPISTGFGFKMIALSVRHELGGTSEMRWEDDGLAFELHIPVCETIEGP